MRNTWFIAVFLSLGAFPTFAQIQFNPQIGVTFADLSVEPRDVLGVELSTEGKAGFLVGADLRIGGKFYIQPGLFVIGTKTVYTYDNGVIVDKSEITRYGAKLKGLVGYKLIDNSFRLRIMGGPTYDFELSLNADDNPYFDKDQFKSGIFNLDAGVGVDILFLTAELGYSWAFTETFDKNFFDNKPRYRTLYATVGIVIGN
jgi:hypothetical protein